jgi:hypothetical protein
MRKNLRKILFMCLVGASALRVQAQLKVTITAAVASSTDDVEENVSGTAGSMYTNSSDLELMTDGSQTQKIGIRFTGMAIPQGATIQRAYIQFATKGDKNATSGTIVIKGEDVDNASTFTSVGFNVSNRPTTTSSVSWAGTTSSTWGTSSGGQQGADQRTPDLKSIVQTVVSRTGWVSGNALAFVFTGTGTRNAYSYDGSATLAPQLIVQYTTATPPAIATSELPLAKGGRWAYNDNGISLDTVAWKTNTYNDSLWSQGPGKLGYSDNAVTVLDFGPNSSNRYITYYFRKQFNVTSVAALSDSLQLNILRDDGAVVYVNGTEVLRSNMPAGAIDYLTHAVATVDAAEESSFFPYNISKSVLVNGLNTIAVELHQRDGTSSDIGFDLELKELPKPSIIRGPYLQLATTNSMNLRWRTDAPTNSRVRWGLSPAALNSVITDSAYTAEHEIKISGLTANTKYWYSVGSTTDTLQGDSNNYFRTMRAAGDTSLMRIVALGDCGNNSTNQRAVRDQIATYLGNNYMDNWILLGDNAYNSGTDAEFQSSFFNIYRDRFLKQNPLFPSPGNHDYGNNGTNQNTHAVPYYDHFSLPTHAEAGGDSSNNEAYYSFNQGNIHFLSLDSYGEEDAGTTRLYDTLGTQVQWIKKDLANNTNKGWVIAYWHHPPYTMGSHTSDGETELVKIRQNFIQILERMGVDLVLCGHSHDYERSKLMQGHYGNEASFDPAIHNISQSSGVYNGSSNSCPYLKDSVVQKTGTVYVVSGSAGQLGGQQGSFPHAALSAYSDASHGGGLVLEVQGNRLDTKWIGADGVIRDQFTMMKNTNFSKTYTINAGDSVALTAGFNGTYSWTNSTATTKTIKVAPTDTTRYVVTDNNNCVTDSFQVNTLQVGPLPVSLLSFRATGNRNCTTQLSWQSAGAESVTAYGVEYGIDGKAFSGIGEVKSSPAGNFTFVHSNPVEGTNYYRLKIAETGGRSSYSAVAVAAVSCATSEISMLPNPVSHTLQVQGLKEQAVQVVIYSADGRNVLQQSLQGPNVLVDVTPLPPGTYTVQINDAAGHSLTVQRIVKK